MTHLKLREEKDKASDKTLYVIAAHEDFYQQADLAMLVAPPLAPLVRAALYTSTLACRVLAFGFSNVLGYWRVPRKAATGAGGGREEGAEQKGDVEGEGEHDSEAGTGNAGAGEGAKGAKGGNGNRRKKPKRNGEYAEAAMGAVEEMQDKGLNAI